MNAVLCSKREEGRSLEAFTCNCLPLVPLERSLRHRKPYSKQSCSIDVQKYKCRRINRCAGVWGNSAPLMSHLFWFAFKKRSYSDKKFCHWVTTDNSLGTLLLKETWDYMGLSPELLQSFRRGHLFPTQLAVTREVFVQFVNFPSLLSLSTDCNSRTNGPSFFRWVMKWQPVFWRTICDRKLETPRALLQRISNYYCLQMFVGE
jgi:hypothetical protein